MGELAEGEGNPRWAASHGQGGSQKGREHCSNLALMGRGWLTREHACASNHLACNIAYMQDSPWMVVIIISQ